LSLCGGLSSAGTDLNGDEINIKLPAKSSGRGVEGHVVIRGYGIVPLVAGAGSFEKRIEMGGE
jgi:hypothetical protein